MCATNTQRRTSRPEFAVIDALILAEGKPTSRNRKRLLAARAAASRAVTEVLFGENPATLVEVA